MFSFVRWQDIADIIIMSFLVYQLYTWFKNTKAFQVFIGLGSLGVLYLITRNLGFFMTSWILQELGTALFVLIIVIFQSEIRQALYRFSPLHNFFGKQDHGLKLDLREISSTVFSMAREKIGALIVFQRKEPVDEYLLHGITLDSLVSSHLVASIFRDGTPLHDGAMVIRNGRIYQASAHLPLSVNSEIPQYYGTRHRAALGITERSDAAVVVVSEERGEVSLTLGGNIQKIVSKEQLETILDRILYVPQKEEFKPFSLKRAYRNFWPKLVTVLLVFVTWLIITAREGEITNTVAPVQFQNLPSDYLLTRSSPDEVEVQLRTFSSLIPTPKEGEIAAEIDLSKIKEGNNSIPVKKEDIKLPSGVVVVRVKPSVLRVDVEKKARKLLKIHPKIVGSLRNNEYIKKINVEPSTVMVEGPERMLARIDEIQTEEIQLSRINNSITLERNLLPPASQFKLLWDKKVKISLILGR